MVRVWDPLVRIFHWSLVISFAIAWVTAEDLKDLHEWAGYAAAALIAFRLVWGLIGPRYARFTQFVKSPGTVLSYLKMMRDGNEPRYVGHNPAGAAMILAMLVDLAVVSWTGWLQTIPKYQHMGIVKDSHDMLASLLMAMVIAHVLGVLWAARKHGENLARSMVTGDKRAPNSGDVD